MNLQALMSSLMAARNSLDTAIELVAEAMERPEELPTDPAECPHPPHMRQPAASGRNPKGWYCTNCGHVEE